MDFFLIIIRIALAAVFGVAGVAKFFDPDGTKKALADFGVPEGAVKACAIILPLAEVAIAYALLVNGAAWYAALGAVALLALFSLIMLMQIASGKTPDCHCFGQIYSKPIGWKSLARNGVFAVLGIILLAGLPRYDLDHIYYWLNDALITGTLMQYIFVIGNLALVGAAVYYLRKVSAQQSELNRQIEALQIQGEERPGAKVHEHMTSPDEGLPIGAPAPDFELPDMNGKTVSFEQLLMRGRAMLFFFISPTCAPCKALLPEIGKWQEEFAGKIDFIFISTGSAEENAVKLPQLGGQIHLLQKKREVAELFKAKWTPAVVLVNADGVMASRIAAGDTLIKDLIDEIRQTGAENIVHVKNGRGMSPNEIKIGEEIPEFELPEITGKKAGDDLIRGKKTLALFWGLDCPHCQRMLPDVKEWESAANGEAQMVIFSTGDETENRAMNLKSPILIDEGNKVGAQLGMFGTPSAVLIDEHGKIVSETAVGAEQIWSLIGKRK